MDREANLPVPPRLAPKNLLRPIVINSDTTSSSSSSFSSPSSPPDLLRHVQAAFKRHRPLGTMQSNSIMPKRSLVPKREASRNLGSNAGPCVDTKKNQDVLRISQDHAEKDTIVKTKNATGAPVVGEAQENASITPPSISGTITNTFDDNFNPFDVQRDCSKAVTGCKEINPSHLEFQHDEGQRKVQFSLRSNTSCQEMEWDRSNEVEASTVVNNDSKYQHFRNTESDISLKPDGEISSSLARTKTVVQDQLHQFGNFVSQPAVQFSVVGSSCATSTSIHSTSAPLLNSTTYSRYQDGSAHDAVEPRGGCNMNPEPVNQGDMMHASCPSLKDTDRVQVDQRATRDQVSTSVIDTRVEVQEHELSKEQQGSLIKESCIMKDLPLHDDKSMEGRQLEGHFTGVQSQAPLSKSLSSDVKLETSKLEKQEKPTSGKGVSAPRKRNYDPDLFFKVNGKLYQRLGKIGSGGSSEVHKVISSDCTIYALKKIKLKGRDYATAYGFCQEIEYLNKLKGKKNIIQLIDYEVTDKALLRAVLNGSMSNKDSRVKDDGYIYMVLEYGEIDLAHMLSQKWKEMDGSNQTIDENWLRFYWQQILEAVNTIHEERIVHSDLKPANFLLVKGFLKLIDFGIAKAINSDTTNIQRDSQVGTLSYMSPEAFMCNESDANGNTIKCGRPSDIWSLGCILYQMVYGRTPFSDYKTFWTKFKVITDPNHEITYEPVPNPWLLDLMKKCLAWDRNERWRIPQLLQHPFLVPPIPFQPSSAQDQSYKLLQLLAESCANDRKALILCSQLSQLLEDPVLPKASQLSTSRDQQAKLLSEMSKLCLELQKRLSDQGRE
ncbi:serine/threonine-protein kinase MPS1-like isoform X2 [Mangifera indica]|uniref:serine/threonine-protein kinase MPS1-like isoform X2 n=1 Tax=Mangifera indica TaxID=29780 RepID=UPI001CFB8BB1|nr:serine/threonine-protein kinase MPS1-like isoform X2 [Mangifera indica]